MTGIGIHTRGLLAVALALALGACGGGKRVDALPAPPVATSGAEIDAILGLLDQGDEPAARKRIVAALKRDPGNPALAVLRASIDEDARQLLGPASQPYTVRAGETMTGLAERFLGNRLKAYQLARYNGITRPAGLAAGQVLRIPGEPTRPEPARRPEPAPRLATPKPKPAAKPAPPVPVAPAAPRAPAANPAAARAARAAGLAALNQGRIGMAIGQLRRAAALDPANPAIARDLARAERIAATVRARR